MAKSGDVILAPCLVESRPEIAPGGWIDRVAVRDRRAVYRAEYAGDPEIRCPAGPGPEPDPGRKSGGRQEPG